MRSDARHSRLRLERHEAEAAVLRTVVLVPRHVHVHHVPEPTRAAGFTQLEPEDQVSAQDAEVSRLRPLVLGQMANKATVGVIIRVMLLQTLDLETDEDLPMP